MAAKEDQAVDPKDAPKKNQKMIIIIGAAALAVILVVVGVLVFAGGGKGEKKGKPAEAAAEAKSEGGGHGGEKGGEKGAVAATVYPLEPFIVNIYDGQDLRYLILKVEFEMASPGVKGELEAKQAPLRDAILVLLTTKTLHDIQDLQGKNQLREEILTAVGKIIAPGKVTKAYFTDFVVQ